VLDRWFYEVVRPRLKGRAFLIRFADDFVIGCEQRVDVDRIMAVLAERFAKYGLTIHPEKTRVLDFRKPGGASDKGPDTFDFGGFTHYWGRSQRGNWVVKRRTAKDRVQRALEAIREYCRDNRHRPVRDQAEALGRKLRGHYGYYGVVGNGPQLSSVRCFAARIWRKWLNRRTRSDPLNWAQFQRRIIANHPLPRVHIHWTVRRIAQRQARQQTLPGLQAAFS